MDAVALDTVRKWEHRMDTYRDGPYYQLVMLNSKVKVQLDLTDEQGLDDPYHVHIYRHT